MVQETHFHSGGSFKFTAKYFPTAYMASDPSRKAGVANLVRRTCPLQIKSLYLDPHGTFILLDCDYLKHSLMLVNVYAPNSGQIQFLTDMFEKLEKFSQPFMIIGGDFYITILPGKDRRVLFPPTPAAKVSRLSTSFRKLIKANNSS